MDKTTSLIQRRVDAVAIGVNQVHSVYIKSAKNSVVYDVDNKRYIDFSGGIACLNTGHLHPLVVKAVIKQLNNFTHSCFAATPYENYIAVCERINALMPGNFKKKSILLTTGSEAVESAIKIARAATKRAGVIVFSGAYHGRSFMTMAMNGKVAPYSAKMGIMYAPVYRTLFPRSNTQEHVQEAIDSLTDLFASNISPEDVCSIVIEPVQGEGGFNVAPPQFLQYLRSLCDKMGIILIVDEVQSGAGRTGTFFAIEQSKVLPDIVVFGKSVAGGLPLSGVVGKQSVMDKIPPGGLGGTWAGNPIACAAALAVLDLFENSDLLNKAKILGTELKKILLHLTTRHKINCNIYGLGAMVALEIFKPSKKKNIPAPDYVNKLISLAEKAGLLMLKCGKNNNIIRFLMPITIESEVLIEGLNILDKTMGSLNDDYFSRDGIRK